MTTIIILYERKVMRIVKMKSIINMRGGGEV